MRTDLTTYVIRDFLQSRNIDATETIIEDVRGRAGDALNAAETDQMVELILGDTLERMPHLRQHVLIPDDVGMAALCSLKEQGAMVRKYGEGPSEAKLKSLGGGLGRLVSGDVEKSSTRKADAKPEAKSESPSRNPFSNDWKSASKTAAEHEKLRAAAIDNIIRTMGSAGAVRMARSAGVTLGRQPLRV